MNEITRSIIVDVYNSDGSSFSVDLGKFNKDIITFGKGAGNDICINSAVLSEQQGYFRFMNVGWVVFDNRSQNAMLINGTPRYDSKLLDGMEIRIADNLNRSNLSVTMVIRVLAQENQNVKAADNVKANDDVQDEAPKAEPEKKSKAPLIVLLILAPIITITIIGAVVIGVFGDDIIAKFKPTEPSTVVESANVEEYTENIEVTETETETQPDVERPARIPIDEACEQMILAECNGSYATLSFYEREDGVWVKKLEADGRIGKNGTTLNKKEGDGCTPLGEFDLTFCCGLSDPGTDMDFRTINEYSVWVDDTDSYYYNTLQDSDNYYKDWDSAEPMYNSYFKDSRHNYCINIAANGDGISTDGVVPGAGSVITLCGKNDVLNETHGCIDISGGDMIDLLSYLDSEKQPVIIIY